MKNLVTITIAALFLISCGSETKTEPTQEDLKKTYEAAGLKYVESIITPEDGIESIRSLKVDSINPVSSSELAFHALRFDYRLFDVEFELLKGLLDINETYGGEPTHSLLNQRDKVNELMAELDKMEAIANKKSKTDTVAYRVTYKAEIVMKDGTVSKDARPELYFDLEHELSAEWNRLKK